MKFFLKCPLCQSQKVPHSTGKLTGYNLINFLLNEIEERDSILDKLKVTREITL